MTQRFERDAITQLAYLMLGLWGFLLYALGPALPTLRRELDVSRATVSLHTTVGALGAVAVGVAGDRIVFALGRRRAFWAAGAAVAIGATVLATGHALPITLAAAALFGLGGALAVVVIQSALADRHGHLGAAALVEANALATALGAAASLAVAFAIVLGGSWRDVFLAAALVAVPALAFAYRSVAFPSPPPLPKGESPALPRAYWWHWLALLAFVATEFCVVFWATDFLESVRGLAPASAAALSSLFLAGMTAGRVAGGPLARRVRGTRLLAASVVVAAGGFLLFWLSASASTAVAGLAVTGFGVALLYPLTLALALAAARGRTDVASARAAFAAGIAIAVAPFVLAALADAADLRAAYALVPVLLVAGAAALVRARRL